MLWKSAESPQYCRAVLITEAEGSEFADVKLAEGDALLLSETVSICIKPLLHRHNLMTSAVGCSLSFSSTALRTAGRLRQNYFF